MLLFVVQEALQINSRSEKNWPEIFENILLKEKKIMYSKEIYKIAEEEYGYSESLNTARKQILYGLWNDGVVKPALKHKKPAWIHCKYVPPDMKTIDIAIGKLIEERDDIPTSEQVEIEVEDNSSEGQEEIFKRLAKIKKLESRVENTLKDFYPGDPVVKGKKGMGWQEAVYQAIEKAMPSDEKLIKELKLEESELKNPAVRSLISLCKKRFKEKRVV